MLPTREDFPLLLTLTFTEMDVKQLNKMSKDILAEKDDENKIIIR